MKAEIIEKKDGELSVKFSAETPLEAMVMGAATLAFKENVSISANSGYQDKGYVMFGGFDVPTIEILNGTKEAKK